MRISPTLNYYPKRDPFVEVDSMRRSRAVLKDEVSLHHQLVIDLDLPMKRAAK